MESIEKTYNCCVCGNAFKKKDIQPSNWIEEGKVSVIRNILIQSHKTPLILCNNCLRAMLIAFNYSRNIHAYSKSEVEGYEPQYYEEDDDV